MQEQVKRCAAGRSVLCAVSGGADSVVLLHLLVRSGVRVEAAHMEHGIRGENSLRDCAFVERLCRDWKVPLHVCRADVPEEARRSHAGLEETARRLRYAFLEKERIKNGLDVIATAHHLNDQAETVLLHIIRGASPRGAEGMAPERGALIRPLLHVSRRQIEAYAEENHLPFVQDETNADTAYTRNYIRAEILPEMERINPAVVEALGRFADASRLQNDFIRKEAENVLRVRLKDGLLQDISDLHPGLRSVVWQMYLESEGLNSLTQGEIARMEDLLLGGISRRATVGRLLFERGPDGIRRAADKTDGQEILLHMGENHTPFGTFLLQEEAVPRNLNLGKQMQVLDAEKVCGRLTVRSRRDGDRVQLLGSGGSKLVSDVLTDKKIPRALREEIPLILRDGEIVWIAGIAPCAPCAVGTESRRALIIKYIRNKEQQYEVF